MALIRQFTPISPSNKFSTHEEIPAAYMVVKTDGKRFLQINTYGKSTRQVPGKVSQTIQLDEQGASQLFSILKQTFAFE